MAMCFALVATIPDPGGYYYPPALLDTIPVDAACAAALLLLALSLIPRPARGRDTALRAGLAVATLLAAVWANLLIVGILRSFLDFNDDPAYQAKDFSGATHDAFRAAQATATLLAEVTIALVVLLAVARLAVALVQVIRFLRTSRAAPDDAPAAERGPASGVS